MIALGVPRHIHTGTRFTITTHRTTTHETFVVIRHWRMRFGARIRVITAECAVFWCTLYAKCIGPFSLNVYSSYLHLAYMYSATAHSHWCVNLNIPDDNVRKSEEAEKSRARRSNGSAIKLTGPRLRRSVEQTANYQTDRRFSRWEPE